MNYKTVDLNSYYRQDAFRRFSEGAKCSFSVTNRVDVTKLKSYSDRTGSSFYLNTLYCLSKAINSREDYRLAWLWETEELICYDRINPAHYVFHEDTETVSIVYTEFDPDYETFYRRARQDVHLAKERRDYGLDPENHPNWFEASCLPWLSYDALHLELPDGYLYLTPILNWGRFREEQGRLMMPVTLRLNHASADGYLAARFFMELEKEIACLCGSGAAVSL